MEMMANVLGGIDSIAKQGGQRQSAAVESCPNDRCSKGHVQVDAGMHWQSQICPVCFGAGRIKVKRDVGADVALTGSHDYAS